MINLKKNIEDIVTEIKLYGYSQIQFYKNQDKTLKKLQSIHNLSQNNNLPGRVDNYTGGFLKYYSLKNIYESYFQGHNYFLDWLNSELIEKVVEKVSDSSKYELDHLYQTLDTPRSLHIAQDPHFDRIPTLKFMLYLNDMDKSNGAFVLSPGSHHWVKEKFKKRGSFNDEKFFRETRCIPKPIIDNLIPLEGKAGTLIIFLTDCIHMQGQVKENESRIFRAGYRQQSKNKLVRYIKLIKNYYKKN